MGCTNGKDTDEQKYKPFKETSSTKDDKQKYIVPEKKTEAKTIFEKIGSTIATVFEDDFDKKYEAETQRMKMMKVFYITMNEIDEFCTKIHKIQIDLDCAFDLIKLFSHAKEKEDEEGCEKLVQIFIKKLIAIDITEYDSALIDIKILNKKIMNDPKFTDVLNKILSMNEIIVLRNFVILTLRIIEINDNDLLITPELISKVEELQLLIKKIRDINKDIITILRDDTFTKSYN